MGKMCPIHETYEPIRRTLTVDQKPAMKADSVIAFELGCGHVVGGEEYKAYEEARADILTTQDDEIRKAKDKAHAQLAQAWKDVIAKKGGVA